jgi:4-diphosphocytidyl-2-C-methyl-D-erythritol kinase
MVNLKSLSLPAPAKLNLFLLITGRRDDGYHYLQTLFQLLEYGDELIFSKLDRSIELDNSVRGVADEDNLVIQAAKLLKQHTGYAGGARIKLDKKLPMGAGLGGGSSDAATTLLGLNRLWNLNIGLDELATLGLQLGADVPVFVRGHSALAEGVGEQLTSIKIPPRWYLVICPQISVNTGEIFAHPELTRDSAAIKIPALLEEGQRNDCQKVVESLYPQIGEARKWLDQYGSAQLTGTGSCLFTAFKSEAEANQVLAKVPDKWRAFVARGLNQSPVLGKLRKMTAE